MESFFATLVSASFFFSFVAGEKVTSFQQGCAASPVHVMASLRNAETLTDAPLAPFGRPELGWQIYAPQMAATIGTRCAPHTPRFAASLARWQARHGLAPSGAVNEGTLAALKVRWQKARPFIANFEPGSCPPPAPAHRLADLRPSEGWLGKQVQLDTGALQSLRRMVADARSADPRIARDRHMLTVVSAYRSPAYDAARCAGGKCNGIAKAKCSAHRTGTAVDLHVGAAPGHGPVDSANANRLFLTRTPTYQWLVANAHRYGFVNYVFEPWHWEWVGEEASLSQ